MDDCVGCPQLMLLSPLHSLFLHKMSIYLKRFSIKKHIDQIIRETVVSNCEISRTAVFCHFFSAIKEYSGLIKYIPFSVFTGALPDLVIKLEHGRASNG